MPRKPQHTQLEEDKYSNYRTDFPSLKLSTGCLHNLTMEASDNEEDQSGLRSNAGKTNPRSNIETPINIRLNIPKKIKSILKSRDTRPSNPVIPSEKMCELLGGETAKNAQRKKSMFNQTHLDTSSRNKKKNFKKNHNSKVKHKNTNRSHSSSEEDEENHDVLGRREGKSKLSKLEEIENKANRRRSKSLPRSSSKRKNLKKRKVKAKKQVKPKSKTKRGNRRRSRSIEKKGYKVSKLKPPIIREGRPKTGIDKKLKEVAESNNPIIVQMNGSELPWNQLTNLFDLLKENLNVQKEIKEKENKHIGNKTVAKAILQAVKSIGTRGFFKKIIAYGEENFNEEMVEKIKSELGIRTRKKKNKKEKGEISKEQTQEELEEHRRIRALEEKERKHPVLEQNIAEDILELDEEPENNEQPPKDEESSQAALNDDIIQEEQVIELVLPQSEEKQFVHSEEMKETEEAKEIFLPQSEEPVEETMEPEKEIVEQKEPELAKVYLQEKITEEIAFEIQQIEEPMRYEAHPTEDLIVEKEQESGDIGQIEEPTKDTGATGEDSGLVEEDFKKDFDTMVIFEEPKKDEFVVLKEPINEENGVGEPKPQEPEVFEKKCPEFNQENEMNEEYPPIAETSQVEETFVEQQEEKKDDISNISNQDVIGSDSLKVPQPDTAAPLKGTLKEFNFSKLSNQAVQLNKDDQNLAQLEKDILIEDNKFIEKLGEQKTHSDTVNIHQLDQEEGESHKFGLSDFGFEMPPLENSSYDQQSLHNTNEEKEKKQDFGLTQTYVNKNEVLGLNNQQEVQLSGEPEFVKNADSNCGNDVLKIPDSTNIKHLSPSPVKPPFL